MQRFHQLLFAVSLVALGWLAMMAVHEPAMRRRHRHRRRCSTRRSPSAHDLANAASPRNPRPAIVVWLGPIVGCALPLAVSAMIPQRHSFVGKVAGFFAGFCLIANGAYLSIGAFDRVGDCGEMLRTGTPFWVMLAFGAVTIPLGLYRWHALGSILGFIHDPSAVTPRMAYYVSGAGRDHRCRIRVVAAVESPNTAAHGSPAYASRVIRRTGADIVAIERPGGQPENDHCGEK